jgi:hypothetical protein
LDNVGEGALVGAGAADGGGQSSGLHGHIGSGATTFEHVPIVFLTKHLVISSLHKTEQRLNSFWLFV